MIDYTAGGYADKCTGIVPAGMWGRDESLFSYDFDLDKASELLTEAGIGKGEPVGNGKGH